MILSSLFFDIRDLVHHKFIPYEQTIEKDFYSDVLRRLREKI